MHRIPHTPVQLASISTYSLPPLVARAQEREAASASRFLAEKKAAGMTTAGLVGVPSIKRVAPWAHTQHNYW